MTYAGEGKKMEIRGHSTVVHVPLPHLRVEYEPSGNEMEDEHFWHSLDFIPESVRQHIAQKMKDEVLRDIAAFAQRRQEDWGLTLANLIQDAHEAEEKNNQ